MGVVAGIPFTRFGQVTLVAVNEVQRLVQGGAGLTSFTLTYAGSTTAAILPADSAATLQAALEALPAFAPGDLSVVKTVASPFVFTITFTGAWAAQPVELLTATATGGTGTVTPSRVVGGDSGYGIAQIHCPGMDWVVRQRSVGVNSAAASGCVATEYLNSIAPGTYLQGTYDGAGDSSSRVQLLSPGDTLLCEFSQGAAGAVATYRADGLVYPYGQGRANM